VGFFNGFRSLQCNCLLLSLTKLTGGLFWQLLVASVVSKERGAVPKDGCYLISSGTRLIINESGKAKCVKRISSKSIKSILIQNDVTGLRTRTFAAYGDLVSVSFGDKSPITDISSFAFADCSELVSVKLPPGLKSINSSAFLNCKKLSKISLPNSLVSIGDSAFRMCKGLTEIHIPHSVVRIKESTFRRSGLRKIVLPSSLVEIGNDAFAGCSHLKGVEVPGKVTSIGDGAFRGCSEISQFLLPKHFSVINASVFQGTGIRDAPLHEGLVKLKSGCFEFCWNLEKVVVPGSVQSIESYVFAECPKLTKVSLPEKLPFLNASIFLHSGISSLHIPIFVSSIGDSCFGFCSSLSELLLPPVVNIIQSNAFRGCVSLKKIKLPESIKHILTGAFMMSGITSIKIPSKVNKIDHSMFTGCVMLSSVRLPDIIKSIGDAAFVSCVSLHRITIPSGVTSIGHCAFGYSGLTSIVLPAKLSSIGDQLFVNCSRLVNVTLPSVPFTIGHSMFADCSKLVQIRLPGSLELIKPSAFARSGLINITIPSAVQTIEEKGFEDCKSLQTVTIGNAGRRQILSSPTTSIQKMAFKGCDKLKTVIAWSKMGLVGASAFANTSIAVFLGYGGVLAIGHRAFANCTSLVNVVLDGPDSDEAGIGNEAFLGCVNLRRLILPKGLRAIGNSSFAKTALKSMEFGDLVSFVYSRVFEGSSQLHNLSMGKNFEIFEDDALNGSSISGIYIRGMSIEPLVCPALDSVGLLNSNKGRIVVNADFQNATVCGRGPTRLNSGPENEGLVVVAAGLIVFGLSAIVVILMGRRPKIKRPIRSSPLDALPLIFRRDWRFIK
jgi:hypothetical protein